MGGAFAPGAVERPLANHAGCALLIRGVLRPVAAVFGMGPACSAAVRKFSWRGLNSLTPQLGDGDALKL